eukprot:NODE_12562_length_1217_cov_2.667890.p1 GENE.NODE_12562_length_1217_cov_2.667890~~NODE_12562_length_1217_cov_2.667890.p1  ORF type:complete len:326 (-),score=44.69 NODE_12562_length_1217_cov_2.667890:193-1170(-)
MPAIDRKNDAVRHVEEHAAAAALPRKRLRRHDLWTCMDAGALLKLTSEHAGSLEPGHYAATLSRLRRLVRVGAARSGWLASDPDFARLLMDLSNSSLDGWSAKDVALASHALACLNVPLAPFFEALAQRFPKLLPRGHCKPQDISNVVYAYSKLELHDEALFDVVATHIASGAAPRLQEFSAQALSNTLFAFGRLGVRHEAMLEVMAQHLPHRFNKFRHQNFSNSIYGFALLDFRNDALLQAMAEHLAGKRGLSDFSPQAVCNTVFSFAQLGCLHIGFAGTVAAHVREPRRLRRFKPRDIAALATSSMARAWPLGMLRVARRLRY